MTNKYNNLLHRFRVYDHETSRLEKSKPLTSMRKLR
nr:MAG TPA: Hemagglutinin HA2 Virus, GP2 Ectodomain, Post-Fusion [Caudoviricetes sp.]DAT84484.1 MAG TPA: Hemagglutinin HA2 Virus, GP2 Ectodomain, Post-Fusion [Caudoviricetes sp.]